jgi:peptidyl-prolyl cis-trans isomerase SurA
VRTLPKNRFLLRVVVAALPAICVLAFDAAPILAQVTGHRHHRPSATTPPAGNGAATAAPAAAPATDADSDETDDPNSNGVAAVVNDQIVSEYDLRQRLALVISTSGMEQTPATLKRLKAQVLDQLKTEKLELEEAQRKNITVSPTEVDKEIDGILKDNHLSMDQLKTLLGKNSVAFETLRAQIAVQLAWQKAIEDEYADRINITDTDVDEELARISEGANKPHYLVAEIFLAIDNPDDDTKVLKNANDLVTQLQNGAPFPTTARQFSQSPSAANGGDIGWVHDGQLSTELNDGLRKLTVGGITPPIRSAGGYYILGLRDRQEPAGTKLPDPATLQPTPEKPGYLPLARVLLPLPPKAAQAYLDSAVNAANTIRQHILSCAQTQKMITGVHGAIFMNLGEMKLSDLSEQMQAELAKTQSGEPTQPFRSSAGIEIIARCDKPAPKQNTAFIIPTRQQVQDRLFQQQISTMARRYIRDLKREANVETR